MRKWKQIVSKFLVASLVLSMVTGVNGSAAEAKKKKENVKVTSVKITNADKKLRLQKSKTFRLKTEVTVKPNKSKYKKVKFTSADRRIVMVNSQGLLKGKKVGTTKITAVSRENKAKKATITVSVTNDILVKTIKLNKIKIKADEFNEDDIQLKVTKISPKKAKNKDINWSTSNEKVADVDDDGVVTTGDAGTAVITASADDNGGAKATCTVVVTPNEDNDDEDDTEPSEAPSVPDEVPVVVPPVVPDPAGPTEVAPEPPTATPTTTPTATPTVTPTVTDKTYNFTDICMTEEGDICSDPVVRPVKDEYNEACTEIMYTRTNEYVFLELPEDINLSDYEAIQIKANVPEQLAFRALTKDLDPTTENWWSEYCLYCDYVFYKGTGGVSTATLDINSESTELAHYITLVSNRAPANEYERENYLIYSITFVPKFKDVPEIVIKSTEDTTEKPTDRSNLPDVPAPAIETDTVIMEEENETAWTKERRYGSQVYNSENGSLIFNSQPEDENKAGEVYNNGVGWYLSNTQTPVDVSEYDYIEVTVSGEFWNVKLMTWSGGQNADNYWDKEDSWGYKWFETPTMNADGSYTMRYAVNDVFVKPQKAKSVGITLKSCEEDDENVYMAKEIEINSIRFTKAAAEPTIRPELPDEETPSTSDSVYYNFTDICSIETNDVGTVCSDPNVAVRAVKDENDEACTEIRYTKTNQCIFFELPETVDLSEYESIRIKANVPEQLCLRVFSEELDMTTELWWTKNCLCESYPFYGGTNAENREFTIELDTTNSEPAKYIELVSNKVPDNGYEMENYLVYSITFVPKYSRADRIVIKSTEDTIEKPTDTSEIPVDPVLPIENDTVVMSQDNETAWAKNGEYGSQIYDSENGSVAYSTEPQNAEKQGTVYNNGVGWYLNSTKTPVDISEYKYIEITVDDQWLNTKLMTWSDGQDADTFWDKKDSWGYQYFEYPIDNEDGTYTMRFPVEDVFTNPQSVKAVGITLKASKDSDGKTYAANNTTIYSIRFTK